MHLNGREIKKREAARDYLKGGIVQSESGEMVEGGMVERGGEIGKGGEMVKGGNGR